MTKKKIFLSYRRDDIPGYVARLEDDLEHAFGAHRVFRDVEDIVGGSEWKDEIENNLHEAGALILIIGQRWGSIWEARSNDPVNFVALELQKARELGLAIIPVTMNSAQLPSDLDLGSVSWLRDKQAYDISDKQGRWSSDVKGLISILENIESIGKATRKAEKKRGNKEPEVRLKRWVWGVAVAALLAAGLWTVLRTQGPDPLKHVNGSEDGPETRLAADGTREDPPVVASPALPKEPVNGTVQPKNIPDISGTWVSKMDGTVYFVTQHPDGSFNVSSPGYADGEGQFIVNMPRKVRFTMYGVGRGEFSVSKTNQSMTGWMLADGSQQKEYDTLQRVE